MSHGSESQPLFDQLLFEITTEELPAGLARSALGSMETLVREQLAQARVAHGAVHTMGTPRRLAVRVSNIATHQSRLEERKMGPPIQVALDGEGKPTPAGAGFAKRCGMDPSSLIQVETDKGVYVACDVVMEGKPTQEILGDVLVEVTRSIPFQKSMRWGHVAVPFARPVCGFVALLDDTVIPLQWAGVTSGRQTTGHRFLAPGPVVIPHANQYEDCLRKHHVVVDVGERAALMDARMEQACKDAGVTLVPDEALREETLFLAEEPFALVGSFRPEYLQLPPTLVVAVMRDHQKYFATTKNEHVATEETAPLAPHYVNVVNTALRPGDITRGNDRVLEARLRDAQFFVDEDVRKPLVEHASQLGRVTFQSKLGTLQDKADRIAHILGTWEFEPAMPPETLRLAAQCCKADLMSLTVGEFPELQGHMGAYLVEQQNAQGGMDPQVGQALVEHYAPRFSGDALPTTALGQALAAADRVDTLVGCFAVGLRPTGSADPFALRRAILGLWRIATEGSQSFSVRALCKAAHDAHRLITQRPATQQVASKGDGKSKGQLASWEDTWALVEAFLDSRLRAYYGDRFAPDIIDACLTADAWAQPKGLLARMEALTAFRAGPGAEKLTVAHKRAFNLTKKSHVEDYDEQLLKEPAEVALQQVVTRVGRTVTQQAQALDFAGALDSLARELSGPVDEFFEQIFVMSEDEGLRHARLQLLHRVVNTIGQVARLERLGG